MAVQVWPDGDGFSSDYGPIKTLTYGGDGRVDVGPLIVCIHPHDYPDWFTSWNQYPQIAIRVDGNQMWLHAANGSWVWILEPAVRRQTLAECAMAGIARAVADRALARLIEDPFTWWKDEEDGLHDL